jgi:hypothetical protein
MKPARFAQFAFITLLMQATCSSSYGKAIPMIAASNPVFKPAAGTYGATQSVKITDKTSGATIYYTTNGKTPTTSSKKYTGAITVSATETIKAIAVAKGSTDSAAISALYTIEKPAATPVFSPKAGTFTGVFPAVKITDSTAGATIYYTTDGKAPTASSAKYKAAIPVTGSETIKAIAVAKGHTDSAVASGLFIIDAATPVFSPKAGTYSATQSVKITDSTPGAAIYYTTDGKAPTTSSTRYTGPVTVSADETLEAIAVAKGLSRSEVVKAAYVITAPSKFTIGGKVSALAASTSVVLEDNGSDALTVSANGPFTFKTAVAKGGSYAVTVKTQPSGQTCSVSDGSGKVGSANVTNVAVSCAATSGSTGGSFWIPFAASPVSGSTGGSTGLFVIASNKIASKTPPTPAFVTTSAPTILGLAFQGITSSTTNTGSVIPALLMYAAMGSDGNSHIYGLDLTDTSTPPVPAQITNLSVPPSEHICPGGQVESNGTMPDTLAVVIYVTPGAAGAKPGTVGYCGVPPGTYELAHYIDKPAVAPTVLDIPGGTSTFAALEADIGFTGLYESSGELGGIVLWNAATKDLNFYSDETFTGSTTLLTDVSAPVACVNENAVANGLKDTAGGRMLATFNTSSGDAAYQITASAAAPTQFFAGVAGGCLTDDNNLYFIGTPSSSTSSAIYQESLAATPPAKKLIGIPTVTDTSGSSLIGSNDSVVLYQNYSESASGITTSVFAVPVGASSTSPTSIGGPYSGNLVADFLASQTSSASGDLLFLTAMDESASGLSYSSEVRSTSGSLAAKLPNTVLSSFGTFATELGGNIWDVAGITDKKGTYGGGTINLVNVASLAPTPLTTTSGSPYVVPAGYLVGLGGFGGTDIAIGYLASTSDPTAPIMGAVVDVSEHVIVPITLTNTNIASLF